MQKNCGVIAYDKLVGELNGRANTISLNTLAKLAQDNDFLLFPMKVPMEEVEQVTFPAIVYTDYHFEKWDRLKADPVVSGRDYMYLLTHEPIAEYIIDEEEARQVKGAGGGTPYGGGATGGYGATGGWGGGGMDYTSSMGAPQPWATFQPGQYISGDYTPSTWGWNVPYMAPGEAWGYQYPGSWGYAPPAPSPGQQIIGGLRDVGREAAGVGRQIKGVGAGALAKGKETLARFGIRGEREGMPPAIMPQQPGDAMGGPPLVTPTTQPGIADRAFGWAADKFAQQFGVSVQDVTKMAASGQDAIALIDWIKGGMEGPPPAGFEDAFSKAKQAVGGMAFGGIAKNILGAVGKQAIGAGMSALTQKMIGTPAYPTPPQVGAYADMIGRAKTQLGTLSREQLKQILQAPVGSIIPEDNAYYEAALRRTRESAEKRKEAVSRAYQSYGRLYSSEHLQALQDIDKELMQAEQDVAATLAHEKLSAEMEYKLAALAQSLQIDQLAAQELAGLTGLAVEEAAIKYGVEVQQIQNIRDLIGLGAYNAAVTALGGGA